MRRVVIVGCASAGKTTLAAALAECLAVPHVERDELGELGSPEYRLAVAEAVAGEAWIFDGAPYWVDSVVYRRVDTVVALDYPRRTVMRRVIWRSLRSPDDRNWSDPNHPVRWAWSVWGDRRREIATLAALPDLHGAEIVRLRSPGHTRAWLRRLQSEKAEAKRVASRPADG
jgi:adenylate kinase family enzyme